MVLTEKQINRKPFLRAANGSMQIVRKRRTRRGNYLNVLWFTASHAGITGQNQSAQ